MNALYSTVSFRSPVLVRLIITLLPGLLFATLAPASSVKGLGWHADALALELDGLSQLPALPEGVSELKFSEFFQMPVGPAGLVFTDKLKTLSGRRVRIMGFMARQTRPSPGVAILAPFALVTHETEYDVCDDLPPAALFVRVAKYQDIAVPHTPGPLLLTGLLETGRQAEADGRVSFVRLVLDPEPTPVASSSPSIASSAPTAESASPSASSPARQ